MLIVVSLNVIINAVMLNVVEPLINITGSLLGVVLKVVSFPELNILGNNPSPSHKCPISLPWLGNTNWRGRLSTVDLLISIAHFVRKKIMFSISKAAHPN
jgi:hypothetical protein